MLAVDERARKANLSATPAAISAITVQIMRLATASVAWLSQPIAIRMTKAAIKIPKQKPPPLRLRIGITAATRLAARNNSIRSVPYPMLANNGPAAMVSKSE